MDIIKTKQFTLRVHLTGILLLAFAVLGGHGKQALMEIGALLLHEGFHGLAMLLLKAPLRRLELTPFGGVMDVESFQSLPSSHRFCIAASGILGSLLVAAICLRLPMRTQDFVTFGQMNLWLGLWNALPALPMDGGQVLAALGDRFSFGVGMRKCLLFLGVGLGIGLILLAFYGAWHGRINVTLLLGGPYLCYAARQTYVTERMRLVEQVLRIKRKLRGGQAIPVDGTAVAQDISRGDMLAVLLKRPSHKLHYFFMVDSHTGEVREILEDRQIIDRLLGEEQDR